MTIVLQGRVYSNFEPYTLAFDVTGTYPVDLANALCTGRDFGVVACPTGNQCVARSTGVVLPVERAFAVSTGGAATNAGTFTETSRWSLRLAETLPDGTLVMFDAGAGFGAYVLDVVRQDLDASGTLEAAGTITAFALPNMTTSPAQVRFWIAGHCR